MKKLRLWLPAIFWMMLIFFLSSRPSVSIAQDQVLNFLFFKGLHLLEYGMLFILIYRATKKKMLLSLILTIVYAISDEIHQLFVLTREGRVRDIFIDSFGAFLGGLVVKRKILIKKLDC